MVQHHYLERLNLSEVTGEMEISQEEEIPESYLAKIFQVFVQRGILESKKGPHGGFYLAVDLKDISIGRIVECLEGEPNLDRCPINGSFCEQKDDCVFYSTWKSHEEAKNKMLKTITLANIMDTCVIM